MAVKKYASGKSTVAGRKLKWVSPAKIQAALYQIADAASAVMDMQSFYRRLHEIVGTLMYAENFFIALHDPETDLITWPYYVDTVDIEQPEPITLKEQHGGTGWILRTGRNLSHAEGTVSYIIEHGEAEQTGTISDAIGVPLVSDGKTVGVLLIQSYRDDIKYSLEHVEIMNFVAQQISIALTRVRAIEETRQRNAELAILNSVSEAMAKTLDVKTVTKIVGDKVRDIFSADQMGILLFEPQTNLIHVLYGYDKAHDRYLDETTLKPIPLGKGLTSKVIELRRPLLLSTREEQDVHGHYMPPKLAGQIKMSESWLGVPIMVNENVLGVVFVEEYRPHAYDENHLRLLQTLSSNMGVAIQNARLFEETQRLLKETEQRNAELAVINSIQAGLANKLEMQAIYDLIGGNIRDIFKAETVAINHYNQVQDLISTPYLWSQGKRLSNEKPVPLSGSPLRKSMIDSRKSWMINRDAEDIPKALSANPDEQLGRWPKSGIGTPIIASERVIGIIQILNMEQENSYTEVDLRLLETISNSMSVALENARLFDETQRLLKETEQRNAELAIINGIQEGLASKLEFQEIVDLVGGKLLEIFAADVVGIGLYDREKNMLSYPFVFDHGERYFPPTQPPGGVFLYIQQVRQPILVRSQEEVRFWIEQLQGENIGGPTPDESHMVVPIPAGEEIAGLVSVSKLPANAFVESDIRFLQTLANAMSVALENARLWEQEKMFRKALQRELEIGREIQQGFLPDALPRAEGWEIAASLMSAREVAGDFYDAFELPDGTIGLVIADVCDKGVGAALFMTLFRSLVRAAANLDYFEQTEKADSRHSSVERLQRAISLTNNYIAETHGESGMFATVFFGILDPQEGRLTYINGGHESPLVIRAGAVRELLSKTGPAVGALVNAGFNILETQMRPGDTFFAFTDGVPDCQNPLGEFFGRERLRELLQTDCSASGLVEVIQTDLRQYIGTANQFDDITLLVVKRTLESAP